MRSNYLLIAVPVLVAATPVAAQDVEYVSGTGSDYAAVPYEDEFVQRADDGVESLADTISNPMVQQGVAAAVEQAAGALMNLPVGPFAETIERARPGTVDRRIGRNSTVADIAGRDTRYLPEELGDRSREAMGMMGGFARAMAAMMPEIERMGRDLEESFRAAKAQARQDR